MFENITTFDSMSVIDQKRRNRIATTGNLSETSNAKKGTRIYCTAFDSRMGRIYVASTEKGVCKISVPKETRKDFFEWIEKHFDHESVIDNGAKNREVIDQIIRFLNGRLVRFTCPVDLIGTPFRIRVWKELMKIPYGATITYKQLAKRVHAPRAFQAVGHANAANPLPIIIPCHRVIGSNGSLVGYSCGIKTKEFLLRLEGAIIL